MNQIGNSFLEPLNENGQETSKESQPVKKEDSNTRLLASIGSFIQQSIGKSLNNILQQQQEQIQKQTQAMQDQLNR